MNKFSTTTAFGKIARLKKEIRVIQGGKGCSKTISILMLFIYMAMGKSENLILSVVAESLPNLKSGALRDFEKLLKDMGVYNQFKVNRTDRTYEYNSNLIEFFSVDGESSRLGSRRTHLYINEADGIKFETFLELQGRTTEFTLIDFNPRRKFWAHTELIGQPHVDFLKLNYLDNEFIPEKELKSILWFKKKAQSGNPYWVNKWRVLGLGELGIADGLVFENWREIDELPRDNDGTLLTEYLGAGLDFGFTHVTAIVKLYRYEDKIILDECLFQSKLTSPMIASKILNDNELMSSVIVADGSRPEIISELRTYGIPVLKANKGAGSVLMGIDLMHTYDILITSRSKNVINEFSNYCYAKDKNGDSLGVPDKSADMDNSIDATRYAFEYFLSKSKNRYNSLRWVS